MRVSPWLWLLLAGIVPPACGTSDSESTGSEVVRRFAGDSAEALSLRLRMVDAIEAESPGMDPRLLDAMRRVPRHLFVPDAPLAAAYVHHRPYAIGRGQTISSAEIVARMTSRLGLTGTEKVLEIGTGSGYQAAVLAELAPRVYSIEIIPELGRAAMERLEKMGYENVHVRIGDGYLGWPEEAPFDAIIVTAAPPETPPALLAQLAPGGRLIVPVGVEHETQWLTLHRKDATGEIHTRTGIPVRFVPMVRGESE